MKSEWTNLVLGDSLELLIDNRGKNPPYSESGIPCVSGMVLTDHGFNWAKAKFISQETWEKWMPAPTQKNDVILTSEAPLGRAALLETDDPIALTQRVFGLRGKKGVLDSQFLYYALRTHRVQSEIQSRATGTTVIGIRQPALLKVAIPAPVYTEQRAIAEVLGALDDKITANNQLMETGESLSTALLYDKVPSVQLGDIASYQRKTVNPSTLNADSVAHFSLPAFDAGKSPIQCNPAEIKSNKMLVETPSVLISKLNPRFPRVWSILRLPGEPALASTEFVVLKPKETSTALLEAILHQQRFGLELAAKVSGTSGSHQRVKPADMLSATVIDPKSINEEVCQLIESNAILTFELRAENNRLEATRDILLPQLMSGKIRVRDAESIVEGVL